MEAAIDLLSHTRGGRRVAILGDMFELGEEAQALHARVGAYAASREVDCLICAGPLSRFLYEAARQGGIGQAFLFADRDALLEALKKEKKELEGKEPNGEESGGKEPGGMLRPGDYVLVKASRGMGFEAVVEALSEQKGSF